MVTMLFAVGAEDKTISTAEGGRHGGREGGCETRTANGMLPSLAHPLPSTPPRRPLICSVRPTVVDPKESGGRGALVRGTDEWMPRWSVGCNDRRYQINRPPSLTTALKCQGEGFPKLPSPAIHS